MAYATPVPVPPVKPITATIVAVVLALLLLPIPGVDALFDLLALLFIGTRWASYFKATRELSTALRRSHTAMGASGKSNKEPADTAAALTPSPDRQPR